MMRCCVLGALFLLAAAPLQAFSEEEASEKACVDDVCFDRQLNVGDAKLGLHGLALYRFWGFRVYLVGLYANSDGAVKSLEGEEPVALELRYFRSLDQEDFVESAQKILSKDPDISLSQLEPAFTRWNDMIRPVSDGDRYTMVLEEGAFSLFLNDKKLGEVSDSGFGRAYLGIWLGDYPVDKDKRDCLLSGRVCD